MLSWRFVPPPPPGRKGFWPQRAFPWHRIHLQRPLSRLQPARPSLEQVTDQEPGGGGSWGVAHVGIMDECEERPPFSGKMGGFFFIQAPKMPSKPPPLKLARSLNMPVSLGRGSWAPWGEGGLAGVFFLPSYKPKPTISVSPEIGFPPQPC